MTTTTTTPDPRVDIQMYRGNTLVFDFQVLQPVPFGLPADTPVPPQDISGWYFWSTFKRYSMDSDAQAVAQMTSDAGKGIAFVDAANGKGEVTMPLQATVAFPDGPVDLIYDVKARDLLGRETTIRFGTCRVLPGATSST